MPVIGSFHGKYWRARPVGGPGPGAARDPGMYPQVQSVVTMMSVVGWVPPPAAIGDSLRRMGRRLVCLYRIGVRLWRWYAWAEHVRPGQWQVVLDGLEMEQLAVLERVVETLKSPQWEEARRLVRACATTPKFHQAAQWVDYSRALKRDSGQAQNVFRHIRVVHELREAHPISNPEAHLLTELAYQGMAAVGRVDRVIH